MTEAQIEKLEELYNEYSYAKESSSKEGRVAARAAQGMWTLETVADAFGYRFEYNYTDLHSGTAYPVYKLAPLCMWNGRT